MKAQSNGTVRIVIPSSQRALLFRATRTAVANIRAGGGRPSIHCTASEVTLRAAGKVIYQKPVTDLTSGKDGEAWKEQIEEELAQKTQVAGSF